MMNDIAKLRHHLSWALSYSEGARCTASAFFPNLRASTWVKKPRERNDDHSSKESSHSSVQSLHSSPVHNVEYLTLDAHGRASKGRRPEVTRL